MDCTVVFSEVGTELRCSEPDVAVVYWNVPCSVVFNEAGIVLGSREPDMVFVY